MCYKKIKQQLEKTNQKQLLTFYNKLTFLQKNKLLNQINKLDINLINNLYDNLINHAEENKIKRINTKYNISPLNHIKKNEIENIESITKIGEEAIKNNEIAVITMAGGMGSRLNHNGPKGTFKLNIKKQKISLFEILINNLKEIKTKYNTYIPWYIMCSTNNIKETKQFFKHNNYFKYPKNNVHFFIQDNQPIVSKEGKILLENEYKVLLGPSGNGNVFKKLSDYNIIDKLKKQNIKWVTFSGIDNVLIKMVDPIFIGLTIKTNNLIASKSISKQDELNKEYIFCKKDNKIYMLEKGKINKEITNTKINNKYVYRETNIVNHLIHINKLEEFSLMKLPYHDTLRNNKYLDYTGKYIDTIEPNSYKFEQYIYEIFYNETSMLLYSINSDEFSPLKSFNDIEKVTNDYINKKTS